jgi:hypothetical protein
MSKTTKGPTLDERERAAVAEVRISVVMDPDSDPDDVALARARLAQPDLTDAMLEQLAPDELAAWRDLLAEAGRLTAAMLEKAGANE